jgi:hypothetical protein
MLTASGPATSTKSPPLANLAHLDWLLAPVTPPLVPGHTTYRLDVEPTLRAPWTYAEKEAGGSYRRVGGGTYDPTTGWYGQGAFNADDVARAAVVYLRHWRATGTPTSRASAYELLRTQTYLQTDSGQHAGNVVLWMQSDGTLNPSADPPEPPDPSDSGESYWLARTIWALGEGYAAFERDDPAFAGFLRDRMTLAVSALERQTLTRYGQWLAVDGAKIPAWLIADGADATGETLLGLAPYVKATADPRARDALDRLAEGVAAMGSGEVRCWPFGALLPCALTRSEWHGWGGLAPAGLARAYAVNRNPAAREAVRADAGSFTPHLLVAGGPDNSWCPAPADPVQVAYGAHSRVESLLAVADEAARPRLIALAGVAGSWFFGNNRADEPMYDPATGRTFDGIDVPGIVHRDSGAESTIHGLLAMLALDAYPEAKAIARTATVCERRTWSLVPVDAGDLAPGGTLRLDVPVECESLLMPIVEVCDGGGTTEWTAGGRLLGTAAHTDEGLDDGAGLLTMCTLDTPARTGDVEVTAVGGPARVAGVAVQPDVEWLTLAERGTEHATALVRSFAEDDRPVEIAMPGAGPVRIAVFDCTGRVLARYPVVGDLVRVPVPPGGFVLLRR